MARTMVDGGMAGKKERTGDSGNKTNQQTKKTPDYMEKVNKEKGNKKKRLSARPLSHLPKPKSDRPAHLRNHLQEVLPTVNFKFQQIRSSAAWTVSFWTHCEAGDSFRLLALTTMNAETCCPRPKTSWTTPRSQMQSRHSGTIKAERGHSSRAGTTTTRWHWKTIGTAPGEAAMVTAGRTVARLGMAVTGMKLNGMISHGVRMALETGLATIGLVDGLTLGKRPLTLKSFSDWKSSIVLRRLLSLWLMSR
jgi:hypothetical protein